MECLFCNLKFKSDQRLEMHYQKHSQERPYFCSKCPKELIEKRSLKYHLETHIPSEERGVECNLCGKRLVSEENLKFHVINRHGGDKKFECKTCEKKFVNKVSLYCHEKRHTMRKCITCNICDKKFSSKQNLKRHGEAVHENKREVCPICDKMIYKSNLGEHLKRHDPQRKRFDCDTCSKSFLTKLCYKEHQLIHQEQEYSFQCDKCDQRFLTAGKLKIHKKFSHLDTKSIIACVFCEKQFPDFYMLQRHMSSHTFERPYLCIHCPAESRQLASLYHHNKIHSKIREQFKCDMCTKSFLSKNALNGHIRLHIGELHYECQSPGCRMKFVTNERRRKHFLKVHVGKQFACASCEKTFLTKTQLKIHAVIHTDFKEYKCDQCDSSFNHRSNLARHKRTVHAFK